MYWVFSESLIVMIFLKCSSVKKKSRKWGGGGGFSSDGKSQTTTAATIVNYPPQEHYSCLLLNNWNRKTELFLQEKNRNPWFSLEEMVPNNRVNHGTVKASFHTVEYQIKREASVKSAQVIIDHQIISNFLIIMQVIILYHWIFMLVIPKIYIRTTKSNK